MRSARDEMLKSADLPPLGEDPVSVTSIIDITTQENQDIKRNSTRTLRYFMGVYYFGIKTRIWRRFPLYNFTHRLLARKILTCKLYFTICFSHCCIPLSIFTQSLKWKQNNLDANRQNVANRLAALSASTASIVTLTPGMSIPSGLEGILSFTRN